MQSVSPSSQVPVPGAVHAVGRLRDALRGGRFWSFVLALLITLTVAESTSAFHWVDGVEVVVPIALLGAGLMGALALAALNEALALAAGVVVGIPVALVGAWPEIHLHHPGVTVGPSLANLVTSAAGDGSLASDTSFYLVLIGFLIWITGGWLSWCVLRWRRPMLGLIPGAAAFATNALNVLPGMPDQNGFALAMIVLIIGLLLWNNYSSSVAAALRANVRLTGDAKWDFWESGLVAMLIVFMLAIFMPQMSKADRTVQIESGIFTGWAQLQSEISHPGFISQGVSGGGTTGFSDDVRLVGSITRTSDPVYVYQQSGEYGGPRYFRGLVITQQRGGEWRYAGGQGPTFAVHAGQPLTYGEQVDALGYAVFTVKMAHAPGGYSTLMFYPGRLAKVDRAAIAREIPLLFFTPSLMSIDRLDEVSGGGGTYTVVSEYSGATAAQLQAAGTDYPDWVRQFAVIPGGGAYRPDYVLSEVKQLAEKVTAGAATPYDAATMIESYLRTNYRYSLQAPTDNRYDSLDYFLFHSRVGYCEYFATAMGDMLRSLGIPTRLVNGFGPGQFDSAVQSYVVKSSDAHTWVEAYFPGYGWIPFEPTPQSNYPVINRGQNSGNVCLREQGCDSVDTTNVGVAGNVSVPTAGVHQKNQGPGGSNAPGLSVGRVLGRNTFNDSIAVAVAAILLLLFLVMRYLRPRSVMGVWNRTLVLASLAGAERRPGETPLELGRRLQQAFPEAAEPLASLTGGFAVTAYAPAEEALQARATVMEAWSAARPHLLRRVFERLKPRSF